MATVRKYIQNEDSENGEWVSFASSDAAQVYSDSPILTESPSEDANISVEEAIINNKRDIQILKKNVSWLAKHGGGGYGGGYGGQVTNNARVVIIGQDGEEGISSLIWTSSISQIRYKILSSSTSKYTVTVKANGNTIYSDINVPKSTIKYIPASAINVRSSDVRLQIFALDENANEFSAECWILVSTIKLSPVYEMLEVTPEGLNLDSFVATLKASVTIPGKYYLYYSRKQIIYRVVNQIGNFYEEGDLDNTLFDKEQYIELDDLGKLFSNIYVSIRSPHGEGSTPILSSDNVDPGKTYPIQFRLVSASNTSLFSDTATVSIVVKSAMGLTVIPHLGQDPAHEYIISADGSLPLVFRVISPDNSGSYNYTVTWKNESTILASDNYVPYSIPQTVYINLNGLELLDEIEGDHKILVITAQSGLNVASAEVYIKVQPPLAARAEAYLKDLEGNIIFDYTVDSNTFNDSVFRSDVSRFTIPYQTNFKGGRNTAIQLDSSLEIINKGVDSTYSGFNFSLNHRAYGVITTLPTATTSARWFPMNSNDTESLIFSQDYASRGFTFDIAFSINSEDEDCTVFNFGNVNVNTSNNEESGCGILIKSHKYYVRIKDVLVKGDLEDSTFTHLAVVFGPDPSNPDGTTKITVFKNGVYHQIANAPWKGKDDSIEFDLGNVNQQMFLACKSENVEFVNTKIYSVRLFSKALNIGQIICSYINNYACYYNLVGEAGTEKNPEVVSKLLTINNIRSDKDALEQTRLRTGNATTDEIDTQYISDFFNFKSGVYTWDLDGTWEADSNSGLPLSQTFVDNVSIPIVTLRTQWTYSDFKSKNQLSSDDSCLFAYRDVNGGGYVQLGNSQAQPIKLSVQGTTSQGYGIKNLEIEFLGENENVTFSPKREWFPERIFTLKADIVDSGHINNAVIGKFVNNCYNGASGLMNNLAFPMKSVLENNSELKNSGLTAKATIEGFPILLIMNFDGGEGHSRESRIIGIYSFNLGRKSIYNLGFEIPVGLNDIHGNHVSPNDATFPGYFGKCSTTNAYSAICFEGERAINSSFATVDFNSEDYNFVDVLGEYWFPKGDSLKNEGGYVKYGSKFVKSSSGQQIPWNSTNITKKKILPCGYFWSSDDTFAEMLWGKVFDGSNIEGGGLAEFKSLCVDIATKLEYSKGYYSAPYNSGYEKYRIAAITPSPNPNEEASVTTELCTTTAIDEETGEEVVRPVTITPRYPQQEEQISLSVKNTAFYYVVCLLFGLVDSFGKNLQMKTWVPKDGSHYYWSPSFYDMDTALGLNNAGAEDVLPTCLDYSITNDPDNRFFRLFGQAPQTRNGIYTAFSNKLWGTIESEQFKQHYSTDYTGYSGYRYYSHMWHQLRTSVINNVDKFIDDYFYTQLEDCGQLIINYDFTIKYIGTDEQSMLHGTRLDFIRNWMRKRVVFLDSIFGYGYEDKSYLRGGNLNVYEVPFLNNITLTHNSGSITTTVTTTDSTIIKTWIGRKSVTYTYVPENTPTEIIIADTLNNPTIQTDINNSSLIKTLPSLINVALTSIDSNSVGRVTQEGGSYQYQENEESILRDQFGTLSNLRVFNLSNIKTINMSIDLFKLFKSWDNSGWGVEPKEFRLEKINYSGVRYIGSSGSLKVDLTGISAESSYIPQIYKSPFKNITDVDISNSNVNTVDIPNGVSLSTLNITNSLIGNLNLVGQPILSSINFTGCTQLKSITLNNCDKFTTLSLGTTVSSLNNLTVINCKNLTSISLDGSVLTKLPKINIQGCDTLQTISLVGCRKSASGEEDNPTVAYPMATSDPRIIQIRECPSLRNISVNNSDFKAIYIDYDSQENLSGLSASGSELMHFNTTVNDNELLPEESSRVVDLRNLYWGDRNNNGEYKESDLVINFSDNAKVIKIKFANIETNPIVLNTSGVFSGCTSLERIYGNLILQGKSTFARCTNLKLFPNDTFGGVSVKSGQRWLHPTEISGKFNGSSTNIPMVVSYEGGERVRWASGDEALNFILRRNSQSSSTSDVCGSNSTFAGEETGIKGPNLSNFEIYYSLFNIYYEGTETRRPKHMNSMFYCLSTAGGIRRNFAWTNSVDNSPNRYMYSHCINIISVDSIYYGTSLLSSGSYRALSPRRNSDNSDFMDDGLLSPLKNCTSTYSILPNTWYCDKNLFRLSGSHELNSGHVFKAGGLHTINPAFVCSKEVTVDGRTTRSIENMTRAEIDDLLNKAQNGGFAPRELDDSYVGDFEFYEIGDLTNFFIDCPSLSSLYNVFNNTSTLVINFDKFNTSNDSSLGLWKAKTFQGVFLCRAGYGEELHLDDLYINVAGRRNLETIRYSFRFNGNVTFSGGTTTVFRFVLDEGTFSAFPNLTSLIAENLENKFDPNYSPFGGSGLDKIITGVTRVYSQGIPCLRFGDILHHGNWKQLDGLFMGAKVYFNQEQTDDKILIPSTLFSNFNDEDDRTFNNLTVFRAGFYNFNGKFELTGEGFVNCPALSDVSYLFGRSARRATNSVSGMVPLKLFYQGEQDETVSLQGSFYTKTISGVTISQKTVSGVPTMVASIVGHNGIENDGSDTVYNYYNYEATEIEDEIILTPATTRYHIEDGKTKTKQLGKVWTEDDPTFIKIFSNSEDELYHYKSYKSSITNMKGCFTNLDINILFNSAGSDNDYPYYQEYLKEDCEDFSPFPYILRNGVWEINSRQNFNRYTFMWVYDGNPIAYYENVVSPFSSSLRNEETRCGIPELSGQLTFENLDEIVSTNGSDQISVATGDSVSITTSNRSFLVNNGTVDTSSPNFCLPPDLFRYSKKSVNISYIFSGCGITAINSGAYSNFKQNNPTADDDYLTRSYGLQGRLCPYLLRPIPNVTRLEGAFNECRYLGYYTENGSGVKSYVIPKTFFSKCSELTIYLTETFRCTNYPRSISLDVFKFANNSIRSLNLDRIFQNIQIVGGTSGSRALIDGIFNKSYLTYSGNFEHVFSNSLSTTWSQNSVYVRFLSVFNSTAKTRGQNIFYGYKSGTVEHEPSGSRTVSTATNAHNYDTVG